MPNAPVDAAFCRLTVLAPRARVDVCLPADLAVAELVPLVLELVGEPVFASGPRPWRLFGVAGGPLPPGRSLRELGVPDGELLRIAPDGPDRRHPCSTIRWTRWPPRPTRRGPVIVGSA